MYDPTPTDRAQYVLNRANFFACHELGHTTGLQHPGNLYGGRTTCMDYDGHTVVDSHDKEHLTDCYPRPYPAPYNLTAACEFEQGGGTCGAGTLAPCP